MATLPNDIIRLRFTHSDQAVDIDLASNPNCGISWPPPERIYFMGVWFKRMKMSALTDEQAGMSKHLARGAEYLQEVDNTLDRVGTDVKPRPLNGG